MLSAAAFQLHMLLTPLVNSIFEQFSFNFPPFKSPKTTFLIEMSSFFRFSAFPFPIVFSSALGPILGPFCDPFWHLPRHFASDFGVLLGPLGASWVLFMALHHPPWSVSGPQSASRGPRTPQNVQNDLPKVPNRHPKCTQIDQNLMIFRLPLRTFKSTPLIALRQQGGGR